MFEKARFCMSRCPTTMIGIGVSFIFALPVSPVTTTSLMTMHVSSSSSISRDVVDTDCADIDSGIAIEIRNKYIFFTYSLV
jgi:hypothetical protein